MGIDNAHIFNHNIAYSNANQLFEQIKKRTGKAVFNDIYNKDGTSITQLPEGFSKLIISTDDAMDADDYIKKNLLLDFSTINIGNDSGHFYINPYVIENSLPEAYLLRWWDTKLMCDLIREQGLITFEEYQLFNDAGSYVLKYRREMQPPIQKMASTAMLTFCSDHHDQYVDHIEQNWSFDDFISWGKKEFIYVVFKDLPLFDFPEKKPDCYKVFIYDNFADIVADVTLLHPHS